MSNLLDDQDLDAVIEAAMESNLPGMTAALKPVVAAAVAGGVKEVIVAMISGEGRFQRKSALQALLMCFTDDHAPNANNYNPREWNLGFLPGFAVCLLHDLMKAGVIDVTFRRPLADGEDMSIGRDVGEVVYTKEEEFDLVGFDVLPDPDLDGDAHLSDALTFPIKGQFGFSLEFVADSEGAGDVLAKLTKGSDHE